MSSIRNFVTLARAAGAAAGVLALALAPGAASGQAVVGTFSGGDPGEGLDLQGNFQPGYAVYAGDPNDTSTFQIQDALFVNSVTAGGIDIAAPQATNFGNTNYGATTNDTNLTAITDYVLFGGFGAPAGTVGVAIDAPVTVGTQYKLQLLFNEACCANRGFDVAVEGAVVAANFNPSATQGDADGGTPPGALVTYTFTAADDNLDVDLLVSNPPFGDSNAIIDAVSLEVVPEPASLGLLALGGLGLLGRRRRA